MSDATILTELVEVLAAHPSGLRRWSVMRAIRSNRERGDREIPPKMEDDVERTFRRFCTSDLGAVRGEALFYRPRERAGEVWAVIPDRARAWLTSGPAIIG